MPVAASADQADQDCPAICPRKCGVIANRDQANGLGTLDCGKMGPSAASNTQIQAILDQAASGNHDAQDVLLARASERLLVARKMLGPE